MPPVPATQPPPSIAMIGRGAGRRLGVAALLALMVLSAGLVGMARASAAVSMPSWVPVSPQSKPPAKAAPVAAYDPATQQFVLFGGASVRRKAGGRPATGRSSQEKPRVCQWVAPRAVKFGRTSTRCDRAFQAGSAQPTPHMLNATCGVPESASLSRLFAGGFSSERAYKPGSS
jgi:hypothetical protein